ncbi:MAG: hypothetical protein J7K22_01490 [Nanoarchaeota archaeon]|nr:hypothetical protein [Nanoarchaeota archaeon]
MTKIFELKDKLEEIKNFVKKNAEEGKITDEILLSLIERQNNLMEKIIDKLEELETTTEYEEIEDA